jgi:endonuclease YncB( thermonuclease family)
MRPALAAAATRRARGLAPWRTTLVATLVVTVMAAGACADGAATTHTSSKTRSITAARVIKGRATVIDGDGLEIGGTKIRLFGIDAPEIDQYCQRNDGTRWRCGHYASVELDRLVASHEVSCAARTVDQYDRSVAVCRVGDVDVAEMQVRHGWAVAYRKFSKDYVDDEDVARASKLGLWAGRFEMPWAWRERARGRR